MTLPAIFGGNEAVSFGAVIMLSSCCHHHLHRNKTTIMSSNKEQQRRTVSLQIPPNAVPGDTLSFVVDESELELTLPEGVCAGEILEIQVGDGGEEAAAEQDNDNAGEEQQVTHVPLQDEKILLLHHVAPESGEETKNSNKSDANDDGTHAMAWPAGQELVKSLCGSSLFPSDVETYVREFETVLELGSGLGLVGLALAATTTKLVSSPPRQRTIVLSDCQSALPLLKYNVQQNQHLIPQNVSVQVQELHWDNRPTNENVTQQKYDLIIGSDLLYNVDMIPALVSTLKHHANKRVLLAVRWRKPTLEKCFFENSSDFIDWKLLVPLRNEAGSCTLSWKAYGDPTNDASNAFFLQTMVAVKGTLKPLADITEEDTSSMSEEEHAAWERLQIQVYEGRVKEETSSNKNRDSEREAKRPRVE